jgi:hypothetical protein
MLDHPKYDAHDESSTAGVSGLFSLRDFTYNLYQMLFRLLTTSPALSHVLIGGM